MKTKHIKIISFAIIAVFIIAILQLVLGVVSDHQSGSQKADDNFNMLMVKISNAAAKYEPGSPEFSSAFTGIMNTTADIARLRLKLDKMDLYEYPSAAQQAAITSEQVQTYSSNTRTSQGRTLSVEVDLYAVRPYSVYFHARTSFILVLAGTIAAVVLLMYLRVEHNQENEVLTIYEDTANANAAAEYEEESEESNAAEEADAEDAVAAQDEVQQNALAEQVTLSEAVDAIKAADIDDMQPLETPAPIAPEAQEPLPAQEAAPAPDAPVFVESTIDATETTPVAVATSPVVAPAATTVVEEAAMPNYAAMPLEQPAAPLAEAAPQQQPLPESTEMPIEPISAVEPTVSAVEASTDAPAADNTTFTDALSVALTDATATENELSLIVLKPADESKETLESVCAFLAEKTGKLGSVYIYNEFVAAIIYNTPLETALAASEALYKQLDKPCVIGISARSERMISATRLLSEAIQAVEHAHADSPIIAFRVDPEKYRKFLQENEAATI